MACACDHTIASCRAPPCNAPKVGACCLVVHETEKHSCNLALAGSLGPASVNGPALGQGEALVRFCAFEWAVGAPFGQDAVAAQKCACRRPWSGQQAALFPAFSVLSVGLAGGMPALHRPIPGTPVRSHAPCSPGTPHTRAPRPRPSSASGNCDSLCDWACASKR